MKSEWKEKPLGSLCSRLSSGKGISAAQLSLTAPIPVYGGNGIRGYVHEGNFSGECAIIGRQGAYCGNVRFFRGSAYMTEHAVVVQANDANDNRFLAYKLSLMDLGRLSGQSAQPGLSVKLLAQQSLRVPSLSTQRKIAAVLSSLDDKIETNHAICRNLEEQMGILYGAFVEQKAWKKSHIGELTERIAMGPFGSNIKVSTFVNEGVPIISGNHLRGKFVEDCGFNFITESHAQKLNRSLVHAGDIVFTHAGTLGQVSVVPDDADYGEYIISQRQFFLRCNQEKALPLFVLLFFHSKWGQWQLLSYANQTGVPSIAQPATNLRKIEIPLPPINAQREWAKCVHPLVDEFRVLWQQNRRLAALRDTLLPRLMSGELDVSAVKL